jgi:hypothetical protein
MEDKTADKLVDKLVDKPVDKHVDKHADKIEEIYYRVFTQYKFSSYIAMVRGTADDITQYYANKGISVRLELVTLQPVMRRPCEKLFMLFAAQVQTRNIYFLAQNEKAAIELLELYRVRNAIAGHEVSHVVKVDYYVLTEIDGKLEIVHNKT